MTSRTIYKSARPGFSLLEVVTVLIIIGILGSIAAVNFAGSGEKARIDATKASMRTLKNALQEYQLREDNYPADLNILVTGQYLEPQSLLDAWKNNYFYRPQHPAGRGFTLISYGKDKALDLEPGGDDIDLWSIDAVPTP